MEVFDLLPKIIRACYEEDRKALEALSLMIIKKIKKDYPDTAAEIAKVMSYNRYEGASARSLDLDPPPVDKETRSSLVNIEEPFDVNDPILDDYTRRQLDDFLRERGLIEKFIEENITPPNSLLLNGAPGVGKTYIAKWISYKLNLPLVTLDLASSISSFLGRSGQNIQSVFDYAKTQNSVLFLDELDAIAKRRDDAGDLGELKRLVNVLLKELESCPSTCVIIAATNHPELLDRAIWRRFDRSLTIPMPGECERRCLMQRHLDKHLTSMGNDLIDYLVKMTNNINAADICKFCEHIKRQFILSPQDEKDIIVLSELFKIVDVVSKDDKVAICQKLKRDFPKLKQRDISIITRISLATVNRYINDKGE